MNLAALLQRAARTRPDSPALYKGRDLHANYATLGARAARLAGWMRHEAGLQPGDRVAFAMTNCVEFQEILWAAWHAGLVAVPVNAKLHVSDFTYIIENSGARIAFATPDLAEDLAGVVAALPSCELMVATETDTYAAALDAALRRGAGSGPLSLATSRPTSGFTPFTPCHARRSRSTWPPARLWAPQASSSGGSLVDA